jgi:hypothetical protein
MNPKIATAVLCALAAATLAGCTSYPENPQYAVVPNAKSGAAFETNKHTYDRKLGGYWLRGQSGAVRIDPLAPTATPADLVLSIRTYASDHAQTRIAQVRVATPKEIITARPNESVIYVIPNEGEKTGTGSSTDILRDTNSIRFEKDDNRVNIIFSGDFLRRYAPNGASIKWFDQ